MQFVKFVKNLGMGCSLLLLAASASVEATWSSTFDVSSTTGVNALPQIGMDSSGNSIAVWSSFDGTEYLVQGSTLSFGGSAWSTPNDISATGTSASSLQLIVSSADEVILAWISTSDTTVVQVSTFNVTDGIWSTPLVVSDDTNMAFQPSLAKDTNGNVVVSWTEFDGTNYFVQSILFTP